MGNAFDDALKFSLAAVMIAVAVWITVEASVEYDSYFNNNTECAK